MYPDDPNLVVLKFGGSVIQGLRDLENLRRLIEAYLAKGKQVAVVVSALKGMTNELLEQAHQLSDHPDRRELDMLVSIGERMSASLLCIALKHHHISAKSFTGSQAGILTTSDHANARIIDMQPFRLEQALQSHQVIVVAGFQGMSAKEKEITTLGRGGSDTTAVALALALKANRVVFYKDVGGLFECDPKLRSDAQKITFCDYAQALSMMDVEKFMLHPRAIELARLNHIPLHVAGPDCAFHTGTLIADHPAFVDKVDFSQPAIYEKKIEPASSPLP